MKKYLFLLIAFLGVEVAFAQEQETPLQKSIFGFQAGYFGLWFHNESRLSNQWTLKSEAGVEGHLYGKNYSINGFSMTPTFTVEPRIYYNIVKRQKEGKDTRNNAGDFFSVRTSYRSGWFTVANVFDTDNELLIPELFIIPTWGIRRNFNQNFNYEVGAGAGYNYLFRKSAGGHFNESGFYPYIHVRLGYTF